MIEVSEKILKKCYKKSITAHILKEENNMKINKSRQKYLFVVAKQQIDKYNCGQYQTGNFR